MSAETYKFKLPVDGGNISIIDTEELKRRGANLERTDPPYGFIDVPSGKYAINVRVKDTWLGNINRNYNITTKGRLYVGDACYAFSSCKDEVWDSVLEETSYLTEQKPWGKFINTGGDGQFQIEITIRED